MKKTLTKTNNLYHIKNGIRIEGIHSGLSGNISGLHGEVSGLSGEVSGLSGNVTGLSGNVTGLSGALDDCEISDEERVKGVNVKDLIK